MSDRNEKNTKGPVAKTREDRLKAALKANLARRKAQARARSGPTKTNEQKKG